MNPTTLQNGLSFAGRILMSLIFIVAGFNKIGGYEGTQGYMESVGVPGMLLPLVILLELGGGLLLLVGFKTRIIAFLLAGFSLLAAAIFHNNLADTMQSIQFMKNLALAGGFLYITAWGPGAWSLDKS